MTTEELRNNQHKFRFRKEMKERLKNYSFFQEEISTLEEVELPEQLDHELLLFESDNYQIIVLEQFYKLNFFRNDYLKNSLELVKKYPELNKYLTGPNLDEFLKTSNNEGQAKKILHGMDKIYKVFPQFFKELYYDELYCFAKKWDRSDTIQCDINNPSHREALEQLSIIYDYIQEHDLGMNMVVYIKEVVLKLENDILVPKFVGYPRFAADPFILPNIILEPTYDKEVTLHILNHNNAFEIFPQEYLDLLIKSELKDSIINFHYPRTTQEKIANIFLL